MTGMDAVKAMSYLFADPPGPDRAMARLEVVTCGGSTGLSMPDIRITFGDGMYRAEIEDAGRTWAGEGTSVTPAVIALLADRAGYRAVITFKPDGEGR